MNFEIGDAVDTAVNYVLDNYSPALDVIASAIGFVTDGILNLLTSAPMPLGIAIFVLLSLWRVGIGFAVFTGLSLWLVQHMGLWIPTMETLALVIASTFLAMLLGLPLGIAMARRDAIAAGVRPVLDLMQTMPAFVYLIPAAMFFGLGAVPGTIATVIFAMPPVVRLTNLGIRQVDSEFIEAGQAFGCTSSQLLFKVQLPNALPSIMAGINQTIMLSLSMVVIASMIGAGGIGNIVLTGIQRLDVGTGFEGGLAVVILAVILDRITQSLGRESVGLRRFLSLKPASQRVRAASAPGVAASTAG